MTRKSLNPLTLSVTLLGGAALSLATAFALNTGEKGNETQSAPLHVQVDNSPLVRDVKEGNSFAPRFRADATALRIASHACAAD